jgi:hypothetical protein
MLTTADGPWISQPVRCVRTGSNLECIYYPVRTFQLNEYLERRMMQRCPAPWQYRDGARVACILVFRRRRGVGGGACDPTLQANEGEAAEADYSLGRGSRPRGTNDPRSRTGIVGPLLRLLKTSLLLLVAGALAAGCGFGGRGDLTLGYLGWDENVANSYLTKVLLEEELGYEKVELKLTDNVGTVYKDLIGGKTDAFLDAEPRAVRGGGSRPGRGL